MIKLEKLSNSLTKVTTNNHNLWFSYETLIAFCEHRISNMVFISENIWSRTTAKHINMIKEISLFDFKQLKREEFENKTKLL